MKKLIFLVELYIILDENEESLPDQDGKTRTLEEFQGKKIVLYFYPKDNTPGCTKQACGFAELYPQFLEKNTVVIGISKDSVASHKKFEEKDKVKLKEF